MELVDQYPPQKNGGFDCNICLDASKEPVVTQCGHLYCWPCIYKWLNRTSKPCPVCNSPLTSTAVVPIYGRGGQSSHSDLDIPRRPSPSTSSTATTTTSNEHGSVVDQSYEQISDLGRLCRLTSAGLVSSLVPWLVGRAESVVCYDEYDMGGGSSGERLAAYRRWQRERLAEVSLSRVSTFLFYCVVLCLLLF